MSFEPPLTFRGRYVDLVPVSLDQVTDLAAVGTDPEIWRYKRQGFADTPERMRLRLEKTLAEQAAGRQLPFTILAKPSGSPIGQTSYLEIRREHRGVSIGDTWLTPSVWRTPVNTEAKYLLLRHAFETEGCLRVQFRTDLRNLRSQRAIERLGARRELVARHDIVMPDGFVRDTVYYSILREEWPSVRAGLEEKLSRPFPGTSAGAD